MIRAVVTAGVGCGLVFGATQVHSTVSATRHWDVSPVIRTGSDGVVAATDLTCAGPDRAGAPGSTDTQQKVSMLLASAPSVLTSRATGAGSVTWSGASGQGGPVTLQRGGTGDVTIAGDSSGQAKASGAMAAGFSASQWTLDSSSTQRGLNLQQCGVPTRDAWLFGGGTDKGRVARLVLANPGATPVTVDAAVVGTTGVDATSSVHALVIPPGARKTVVLGALAATLQAPAVHVTSVGGGVVAALTDSWMSGETPVGESTSGPAAPAATSQVLPAVTVGAVAPQVRVAVPGASEAIVRVRAVNASGAVLDDQVQTIAAGTTAAITPTGLQAGTYAVQVTADEPVVAGALTRTAASGVSDIAWLPSATAVTGLAGLALPQSVPAGQSQLVLVGSAAGSAARVVVTTAAGTTTKDVALAAGRPTVVSVTGAQSVWVKTTKGSVYAGLVIQGKDSKGALIAEVPLAPAVEPDTGLSATAARY
ncbi:DUF5719 family protein [Rudaeicoccus suwonensis]|uniref:DUF5719 family protein n=1 Tax=Rudaeicoccus suwonensis TaxID=657409 RepID=UPI0011A05C66|nr:DUF5719 family protein [Rudaeicoccus suwonensis]